MDPMTIWAWSLAAGAVVIVAVAALLLAILAAARSIDHHALDIWEAGKGIAANTASIWMLERTNNVAREILATAQSIDNSLKSLAPGAGD